MACGNCNHTTDIADETAAVKAASEIAQKYKLLCRAVVALAIAFVVMACGFVAAIINGQQTINDAVLTALQTVAEMEVISETTTTTVTQDTGEGTGNNNYFDGGQTTYNEGGEP